MVEAGIAAPKSSAKRFNELTAEQREIERALSEAKSPDVIEFHPEAAERYRAKVDDIHATLKNSDHASLEAITLVRDLIDHIVVTPTPKPDPVGLEVAGSLAVLMMENPSGTRVAESLVAGAGFDNLCHSQNQRVSDNLRDGVEVAVAGEHRRASYHAVFSGFNRDGLINMPAVA